MQTSAVDYRWRLERKRVGSSATRSKVANSGGRDVTNRKPAAKSRIWSTLAAGKIAYGPCAARLVTVFGAPKDYASARKTAEDLFEIIDSEFRDKPFAVGQTPTIADIAAYSYIAHAPEGGISLEPYPHLRAWLKRVEALPRFLAMPATKAGLLAESSQAT